MTEKVIILPKGELTPQETVAELDKYIIGQNKAKRAVAIALRNRYRRRYVKQEMREDIRPKNLLLIGPTGVGKTEIARRLSKIARLPFVKVEATKFTEVGYMGRDVDSMVRDLVEVSIGILKKQKMEEHAPKARAKAYDRILDILLPESRSHHPLSGFEKKLNESKEMSIDSEENKNISNTREELLAELKSGKLNEKEVEIEVNESVTPVVEVVSTQGGFEEMGFNFQGIQSMLGNMFPPKHKQRKAKISEAMEIFYQEEISNLLDHDDLQKEALTLAQENGIIFLDEIDKIASSFVGKSGPDVSREGVQRDLLPLVEGTTIMTKYGMVKNRPYFVFCRWCF